MDNNTNTRNAISPRRFVSRLGASAALGLGANVGSTADPITLKFAADDTTQDASYTRMLHVAK